MILIIYSVNSNSTVCRFYYPFQFLNNKSGRQTTKTSARINRYGYNLSLREYGQPVTKNENRHNSHCYFLSSIFFSFFYIHLQILPHKASQSFCFCSSSFWDSIIHSSNVGMFFPFFCDTFCDGRDLLIRSISFCTFN